MNACDLFIKKIQEKLPDECSAKDLVAVGLFKSEQAAAMARYMHNSPGFFKLGGRVIYPKDSVIEWLKENKHEGCHDLQKQTGMANCCRA